MSSEPESAISHASLATGELERARAFPEFWLQQPLDGQRASVGNGTHVAFLATSIEQVHAFHAAAIAAGGTDAGAAGPRPESTAACHGAFVRDPDGRKIEATWFDPSLAGPSHGGG